MTGEFPGQFHAEPVAGDRHYYRASATVQAGTRSVVLEAHYLGTEVVKPEIRWPTPGRTAELVLVTDDGTVVALHRQTLEVIGSAPVVGTVTVPPGVWTEIPTTGVAVFHGSGADRVVSVFEGDVFGLEDLTAVRVRSVPDRGYDDTYEYGEG